MKKIMKELNYDLMEEERDDNLNQQSKMLPRPFLARKKETYSDCVSWTLWCLQMRILRQ